jgi:hypothetical protein
MGQAQLEITNTGSQEVSISHMFNHVLKTNGAGVLNENGVITLGSLRFTPTAANVDEYDGAYKKRGKRIIFDSPKHKLMAALVKNKHGSHLVSCSMYEGKVRYMTGGLSTYAEDLIYGTGRPSYSEQRRFVDVMSDVLL